jgi:hypothetical protein
MLPIIAAETLKQHLPFLPIKLCHAYAILDCMSISLAVMIALNLTKNAAKLMALGVMSFYLLWTITWFNKAETLPSVAIGMATIFILKKYPSTPRKLILLFR